VDKSIHAAVQARINDVASSHDVDLVQSLVLTHRDGDVRCGMVNDVGAGEGMTQRPCVHDITSDDLDIQPLERPSVAMNQRTNPLTASTQRANQASAQMPSGTGHNDTSHD
jgi:hypothetical protein